MYKRLLRKLLKFTSNLKPEEKEKLLDRSGDYFLDTLSGAKAKRIKDAGTTFLEETELVRANYWQEMKDAILTDPEMEKYDPRALNYMLDTVMTFDSKIVTYCKDKLEENEEQV